MRASLTVGLHDVPPYSSTRVCCAIFIDCCDVQSRLYDNWTALPQMDAIRTCVSSCSLFPAQRGYSFPSSAPRATSPTSVASPSLFQQTPNFLVLNAHCILFFSLIQLRLIVLLFGASTLLVDRTSLQPSSTTLTSKFSFHHDPNVATWIESCITCLYREPAVWPRN